MYIFFLGNYINNYITKYNKSNSNKIKELEKYNLPSVFLKILRTKFYGTDNEIIPENIKPFFQNSKIKSKIYDQRAFFSNYYYVRNYIFHEFANIIYPVNNLIKKEWIRKNFMWIHNFIPENFIQIINSTNITNNIIKNTVKSPNNSKKNNQSNNQSGGKKKK